MRSAAEIRFRIRQEAANLRLLLRPPECAAAEPAPLRLLPNPHELVQRISGTPFGARVEQLAEAALQHDFPLLGARVHTGPEIHWRRDYGRQIETAAAYFRRIPYLDANRAGDHKIIWELNRHQHLVLLAQAWRLTGRDEFYAEIIAQLESWLGDNPFQRGINWCSALEVGFRALSWIWVYHLAGERMEAGFRQRFLTALYRHGLHLERNLSTFFSRNTHLLGEAVALHALGALFPAFPQARRWAATGSRIVHEEIEFQVREDGSHFEQSTYYHVYALDMFLFHAALAHPGGAYGRKLAAMAHYLSALLGPNGAIPLMGDDDGGRLFHPYGERREFGRATRATAAVLLQGPWRFRPEDVYEQAAWWLGERAFRAPRSAEPAAGSCLYPDAGLAVMRRGDLWIYVDAGPLGTRRAGHGHSDTLSVVAHRGAEEILIDPGTYTYVSDPEWRDRFRGSAAHNTVRIDGMDQAVPMTPFGWSGKPETRILKWSSDDREDLLEAECRYAGFTHRRRVRFEKPDKLVIADEIQGPPGEHLVEQYWHPGEAAARVAGNCYRIGSATLTLGTTDSELSEGGAYGWRSPALGVKVPMPLIRAAIRSTLPLRLESSLSFDSRTPG